MKLNNFIDNRYTTIYFLIVNRALSSSRKKSGLLYYERHHILPRAMGGSDDSSNLVLLTAREHYLCHMLLTRMTRGKDRVRMRHAFSYMVLCRSNTQQRFPSSRMYEQARIMACEKRDPEWAERISISCKERRLPQEAIDRMAAKLRNRKLSKEHCANISTNHARAAAKPFIAITPDGNKIEGFNLQAFCRQHNLDYQNAWLNMKRQNPIKKGRMKGWRFIALPSSSL